MLSLNVVESILNHPKLSACLAAVALLTLAGQTVPKYERLPEFGLEKYLEAKTVENGWTSWRGGGYTDDIAYGEAISAYRASHVDLGEHAVFTKKAVHHDQKKDFWGRAEYRKRVTFHVTWKPLWNSGPTNVSAKLIEWTKQQPTSSWAPWLIMLLPIGAISVLRREQNNTPISPNAT